MEDLRGQIREAFEREQAKHPPAAGMRPTVLAAVFARPRQDSNRHWIAAVAALLLAALVVAALLATRMHQTAVPANRPVGGDYGPPPAGVALLYVQDPGNPSWWIGVDWTGKPRGTIKLPDRTFTLRMTPDGSAFERYGVGPMQFLDRLGKPLAPAPWGDAPYPTATWADDNRHLCYLTPAGQSSKTNLWTWRPGDQPRVTAVVDTPDSQLLSIAACSPTNHEAIVVRESNGKAQYVYLVAISDGGVPGGIGLGSGIPSVVGSSDTNYIALNATAGMRASVQREFGYEFMFLDPSLTVLAFSGDDSLVLVSTAPIEKYVPSQLEILDWRSKRVVWQYHGPQTLFAYTARPNGRDFALGLFDYSGQYSQPVFGVVIVHPNGSSTAIPGSYTLAW